MLYTRHKRVLKRIELGEKEIRELFLGQKEGIRWPLKKIGKKKGLEQILRGRTHTHKEKPFPNLSYVKVKNERQPLI